MKAIIRTIIVVILIAAVAAIGWLSYGFREWDPDAWKSEIEDLTAQEPVVDGDGNELDPDGVNPLPSAMTFSSALNLAGEATSVTVHATINPSTVADTFKALDWSVAWNDPNSAWASGKTVTDYVTVTPISDGAATATIACSQAFGEQIILTCSSRYAPDTKDTATIDYMKKVTGFVIEAEYVPLEGALEEDITLTLDSTQSVFEYQFPSHYQDTSGVRYNDNYAPSAFPISNVDILYSDGTITPTDVEFDVYFTYNSELKSLLEASPSSDFVVEDHRHCTGASVDSFSKSINLAPYTIFQYEVNGVMRGYSLWMTLANDEGQRAFSYVKQMMTRVDTYGELEVVISYGGDKSYSKTFELKPAEPLYPSNVILNNDAIVF